MTILNRIKGIEKAVKARVGDKPCKVFILDENKPEYQEQLKEIEAIKANDSADLVIISVVTERAEVEKLKV